MKSDIILVWDKKILRSMPLLLYSRKKNEKEIFVCVFYHLMKIVHEFSFFDADTGKKAFCCCSKNSKQKIAFAWKRRWSLGCDVLHPHWSWRFSSFSILRILFETNSFIFIWVFFSYNLIPLSKVCEIIFHVNRRQISNSIFAIITNISRLLFRILCIVRQFFVVLYPMENRVIINMRYY